MQSWLQRGLSLAVVASLGSVAYGQGTVRFEKKTLSETFRSEGVAAGDFNHDGKLDIASGQVYYTAPDWKMTPVFEQPKEFQPQNYSESFNNFSQDFDGDGWDDILVVEFPGKATAWYQNPKGEQKPWKRFEVAKVTCNESPDFLDLDGDGKRELVCALDNSYLGYCKPAADPFAPWTQRFISPAKAPSTDKYAHGIGAGDINGDGRKDILVPQGWYEAPASGDQAEWTFHPVKFGAPCGHMVVYDCDGDGDNDVITSSAHAYGIWWHEQTPDGFVQHEIDRTFSQTHALVLADINGDGLQDFVTGKRWWAHAKGDPGVDEPAVLFWFELQRKDGKATWIRHQIDHNSGVGTQFEVVDMDADKMLDIIVSNKRGTFFFKQVRE